MKIILQRSPKEMNPFSYLSLPEWYVHRNLTASLVELDPENQVVPGIAKSLSVTPDQKIYRFVIDTKRRWSDGSPITAKDVWRSLTYKERHRNANLLPKVLKEGPIEEAIQIEGEDTVVIHLAAPAPRFIYHLSRTEFGIVDVQGLNGENRLRLGLRTSGDYRIAELDSTRIILEKNPYSPKVCTENPNRVEFFLPSDPSQIATLIREGQVDFYEAQSDEMLKAAEESALYQIVDGGLDNLATLQFRKFSATETETLQILARFIEKSVFVSDSKRLASRLTAYSYAPANSAPERLTVDEAKRLLGPAKRKLHLELGDEATKDQIQDAKTLKAEAAKIGIEVEIDHPIQGFRKKWEKEDYGLTLTRMGVYADDEVELLFGYFCTGYEPYRAIGPVVCDGIQQAAKADASPEEIRQGLTAAYTALEKSAKIIPLYHFPRRYLVSKKWQLKNYNRLSPYPVFTRFHRVGAGS